MEEEFPPKLVWLVYWFYNRTVSEAKEEQPGKCSDRFFAK